MGTRNLHKCGDQWVSFLLKRTFIHTMEQLPRTLIIIIFNILYCIYFVNTGGINDWIGKDDGKAGNKDNLDMKDKLPYLNGHMKTLGTVRYLSVIEQTAVFIGEAKHGLWRVQENGMIREYRKKGKHGIKTNINPNDPEVEETTQQIINDHYAPYLPNGGWKGYKYPDDKISKGDYDGIEGSLNFIDLSIYHSKYEEKYNNHIPIDLPYWYCTLSQDDYPHVTNAWNFARTQPQANVIGPLGIRAGFDIKENFQNVIRFDFFSDAGVWANIGNDDKDDWLHNLKEIKENIFKINYQRVDMNSIEYEVYLFERAFFNKQHIFIAIIMETKSKPSMFSYVRPNGVYWEGLIKNKQNLIGINTRQNYYPKINIRKELTGSKTKSKTLHGLPLYCMHHGDRDEFHTGGGSCPNKGGDWGHYPWSNAGSGWPTNYEEITPLCDAIVIDLKLWTNLGLETWNDEAFGLGNKKNKDSSSVQYTVDANMYGKFTDPYLTHEVNPFMLDLTTNKKIIKSTDQRLEPITYTIQFTKPRKDQRFNYVKLLSNKNLHGQKDWSKTETVLSVMVMILSTALLINIMVLIKLRFKQQPSSENINSTKCERKMRKDVYKILKEGSNTPVEKLSICELYPPNINMLT